MPGYGDPRRRQNLHHIHPRLREEVINQKRDENIYCYAAHCAQNYKNSPKEISFLFFTLPLLKRQKKHLTPSSSPLTFELFLPNNHIKTF
ncbi:MAG: hypothetical protein CSA95_05115 [Bacteroidetes bacterium]|nr:MAG: hypothetical protein CSA95_05115 [Bacteroidota bacterium]